MNHTAPTSPLVPIRGARLVASDPATGRKFVIAVESVREVDGRCVVAGRVVRPRRYRGNIVTTTVACACEQLNVAQAVGA